MDAPITSEQNEATLPETSPPTPEKQPNRLAGQWQFPRRIIVLLIAFGLASALIVLLRRLLPRVTGLPLDLRAELDWSISMTQNIPVSALVSERMPNTLLLLGIALGLALVLALVATLVAILVHKLEMKVGPVGSILKGLGRLWIFSNAATPVFVMAIVFILIFAVWLDLLPVTTIRGPDEPGNVGVRLRQLIMPALVLSLLPATLTAQAVTRAITLSQPQSGSRLWLSGLLKGLGVLLGQVGGLLSSVVLVEIVFAWPGLGNLFFRAVQNRDFPVVLGVLSTFAGVILAGRLAAELFRWLERMRYGLAANTQPAPLRWRRIARIIWVVAALALLLIPVGLAVAGVLTDAQAALRVNPAASLLPPSPDHFLGTDRLGRDLQARVFRGALTTLGPALLAAVVLLIPGGLIGALTGWLASRQTLWRESIADLILLPADVLLYFPAVPAAIMLIILIGQPGLMAVALATTIILLPRVVRLYQTLWLTAPEQRRGVIRGLAGLGALLLGTLFAGFGLVAALDFLGFGTQPPVPTLGGVLSEARPILATQPIIGLAPAIVIGAAALAFYTAADALVGFFQSKEPLARLNE